MRTNTSASKQALPGGKATIPFEFAYDGGLGKGEAEQARNVVMLKRALAD